MPTITVDGRRFEYERQAKNRSESVFEAVLIVESRTGERSVRTVEIDASARDELTADRIGEALEEWKRTHPTLSIQQLVVEETTRCGFGQLVRDDASATAESASASSSDGGGGTEAPLYRGGSAAANSAVSFHDVPVDEGDEVQFHVAGPSSSVYGTETGTVTGVKTGTEDYDVLFVETDSGTKRVREDWIVEDDDDDADADEEKADADDTDTDDDS